MKKIEKFNYQLIPSSHKGFKEVLVTFEYKGKTCHYYSFIKENAKLSGKQYVNEAKKEVAELTKNGRIYKYAKKYLRYPIQEEEQVKTVTVVKKVPGKSVVYSAAKAKKPYRPYLAMCICGVVVLAGALALVIHNLVNAWPAAWMMPEEEKFRMELFYYIAIGLGVLAIVLLAVGIPLFVKKFRRYKKGYVATSAPKQKKK